MKNRSPIVLFSINVISLILYSVFVYLLLKYKDTFSGNFIIVAIFISLILSTMIGFIQSYILKLKVLSNYYKAVILVPIISFIILFIIDRTKAMIILFVILYSTFENYNPIVENENYFVTHSFSFMSQDIFEVKKHNGFLVNKIGLFRHNYELTNSIDRFYIIDSNNQNYIKLFNKDSTTIIYEIEKQ